MGISGFDFEWELKPNEKFETPEVVMVYSDQGINDMSNTFHDLYNQCLLKKQYHHPIVVNNWEATYFDFNEEKLTKLIQSAKGLGIETFVLDDGWFGKRNNDESSLGDWKVNLTKLPGGLEKISQIANENGLKFGLWFEPEAISIDSDLYRAHPDYAIKIANRDHAVSRCELLLDLSRKEVCDYVINAMSDIIDTVKLSYIKWDFNRNVTETYSKDLAHKYVLGLYYILETLTTKYPNLLIEGCSGGGGRVDPGMLYYTPQIWTSDDSDAIERLFIQYGTSICYPPTTMVGHVSVTPNHQTGRITPFNTRGIVAMSANFGYELNPQVLTEKEREMVKEQTSTYANLRKVIYDSDFYRLRSPFKGNDCAWSFVSKDKKKFYIQYSTVMTDTFDLIQFLAEIINLKDDIAFFPDNEGSLPLLYVKSIDEKNIRFIFAHDYELYASFANNIIDDYDLNLYKIECDILIDKKIFLKEFYKILSPFVNNYNLKEVYAQTFNIKKAKMYMDKISDYLY